MASSAAEAIKKEKALPADDVWIDEQWKQQNPVITQKPIGFVQK